MQWGHRHAHIALLEQFRHKVRIFFVRNSIILVSFVVKESIFTDLTNCTSCPTGTYSIPGNLARSCGTDHRDACPVVQSSTYEASFANVSNDGFFVQFTLTKNDPAAWLRLDFGTSQTVESGKIWGRTDCCQSRLDGFQIWVGDGASYNDTSNINCFTATTAEHSQPPYTHSFGCIATQAGRYLYVVLTSGQPLSIVEIQIYPTQCPLCSAGTYSSATMTYCSSCPAGRYANSPGDFLGPLPENELRVSSDSSQGIAQGCVIH